MVEVTVIGADILLFAGLFGFVSPYCVIRCPPAQVQGLLAGVVAAVEASGGGGGAPRPKQGWTEFSRHSGGGAGDRGGRGE